MGSILLASVKHVINWDLSYVGWIIYLIGALMLLGIVIAGVVKKPKYTKKYKRVKQLMMMHNYSVLTFVCGLLIAGFAFLIWTSFQKTVPANVWKVQRAVGLILLVMAVPCVVISIITICRDFWWFFYYQMNVKKYDKNKNREIIARQRVIEKVGVKKNKNKLKISARSTNKKNPFKSLASSYQQSQNRIRVVNRAKNNDMDNRLENHDFMIFVKENNRYSKSVARKIAILMLAVGTIILGVVFFGNGIHHQRAPLLNSNQMNIVLGLNIFFNIVGMASCAWSILKCFLLYYGQLSNKRIIKLSRVIIIHDMTLTFCFIGLFFVNLGLITVG